MVDGSKSMTRPRKMPAPWTDEVIPGGFRSDDPDGKAVAYCYGLAPSTLPAAGETSFSLDEAKRVASNFAKLPELLKG